VKFWHKHARHITQHSENALQPFFGTLNDIVRVLPLGIRLVNDLFNPYALLHCSTRKAVPRFTVRYFAAAAVFAASRTAAGETYRGSARRPKISLAMRLAFARLWHYDNVHSRANPRAPQ